MQNKADSYELLPCGCISFYSDGTIISINQTFLTWLNLKREEVIHKKKFNNLLSVGGKLYYQMVIMPLLFRQGHVNEINFDFKVDGNGQETFPALLNAITTIIADEELKVITAVVLKITDRKKLEAELQKEKKLAEEASKRFETLANIIPDIIWTALPSGEINFVNKRFYEKFGITADDFTPASIFGRLKNEDRRELVYRWKTAFGSGNSFEAETRILMPDGVYYWYLIRAVPYAGANGQINQWFGSCTDIHTHKEKQLATVKWLNASLTEADQIISQQDQTLEEISYYQSHSVRKPLANIMGLVQMMNTNNERELREVLLPMLQQSAEELDEVIKSIVA